MENKKLEKSPIAKEALKALKELEHSMDTEKMIKDNTIRFKVKDKDFRVRLPNLDEQHEIETEQRKKYLELINDESFLFRKQWVEKYKNKGIDIDAMETEMRTLDSEIKKLLVKLATTTDKKGIEEFKKDINKLRDKQYNITIEKTDLLSYSIEDQLQMHISSYTAFLVLEQKIDNKWIKIFKDYKDFSSSSNADLINQSFYFLNYLIYNR